MVFIGICGASGSGKSTMARELEQSIHASTYILPQDAYYSDHPDLTFEQRCLLNYDEPGIFDHELLAYDVNELLCGRSITRKAYNFSKHERCDTTEVILPPDVLIMEGIHTFYDKKLCEKMDLKIYIEVDPDICLLRRIRRDIKDRGRSIDSIASQYMNTVRPMYEKYVSHYVEDADVVVHRGGRNSRLVPILAGYIRSQLAQQAAEGNG